MNQFIQPNKLFDPAPNKIVETELGLASVPAMAIGSSTEVLVSIVENQAGFRRNSIFNVNSSICSKILEARPKTEDNIEEAREILSPDCDLVKSPSTELTNPSVVSSPTEVPRDISMNSFTAEKSGDNVEVEVE